MTAWDRSAILMLGAAGFVFSYDALRQIAIAIHARETLSYLFPVFIDGFIAYGVRAIVLLRHQRFGARLYAWFLFLTATGASLGANALHAITLNDSAEAGRSALHLADSVVGVLSMAAPLALAGSVHLYILMARTAELSVLDGADSGPGPTCEDMPTLERVRVQASPRPVGAATTVREQTPPSGPSAADSSVPSSVDLLKHEPERGDGARAADSGPPASTGTAGADEITQTADGRDAAPTDHGTATTSFAAPETSDPAAVRARADGEKPSVPNDAGGPQDREADDEWLAELLPLAQAATAQAGRISRDVVAGAVRKHQAISNDRLGLLLARLREEPEETARTLAASSSALW
ncbi:DUF2637 domain-containing protein [Streptomyces sioyaensis]|uniref:DUF2637 domain-containing protein n=1 Tax=Streptomyces sioyaensis TaxID=67364 RepID=UPI0033C5FB0B